MENNKECKTETPSMSQDDCFIYAGLRNGKGYGFFQKSKSINGKEFKTQYYVHRLMYETAKGKIPVGYQVDHLCSNSSCINPDHLEAVTHKVNVQRYFKRTYGTVCRRGHIRTTENTRRDNRGMKICLVCDRKSEKIRNQSPKYKEYQRRAKLKYREKKRNESK